MKAIPVETTTVDLTTGEVVERRQTPMRLLPVTDPEACQECGRRHPAEQPHDVQRLHYQYSFYADHGRWPTWKDAVAHCPEEVRAKWEAELRRQGHWPVED